ncbi:MAG: GNAT family N-acetyltransferase [Nitratireductor sp.]
MSQIRNAEAADIPVLEAIEAVSFPFDRISGRSFKKAIRLASQLLLVSTTPEGDVSGYALIHFRKDVSRARLHSIAVAPAMRGHGIGRDLLVGAEAEAARRGCASIRLEIPIDNTAAQEFHQRQGYAARKIIKTRRDEVGSPGGELVQMEKALHREDGTPVVVTRQPSILIVVGRQQDRKPLEEAVASLNIRMATASEYLSRPEVAIGVRQVINLCPVDDYLSQGYYVSLLAKARAQRAMPNIDTVTGLIWKKLYKDYLGELTALVKDRIPAELANSKEEKHAIEIHFGSSGEEWSRPMAARAWRLFPAPTLEVLLVRHKSGWSVDYIWPLSIASVQPADIARFTTGLSEFCQNRRNPSLRRKRTSFDLAILFDPKEAFPPSTEQAIKHFMRAADKLNIQAEVIGAKDIDRLSSFDALFIRETTNIDNHTFTFAKAAEAQGMPVIDDPVSILRCSNKVYLHEAMARAKIATPKTILITRANMKEMLAHLSFPLVLKIPDGSFSRGVIKVRDANEYHEKASAMLEDSFIILAQEFLPTAFDWRIGVLDGKPLFACKYHMARGHWQIYNHKAKGKTDMGDFETMRVEEAPQKIVKTAIRASLQMGRSLYGVDLKEIDGTPYVIEVNDNPNVDTGVEDKATGEEVYNTIISVFRERILVSKGLTKQ